MIIYARLFDIGYSLSHDILVNTLTFLTNTCSSLISIDSQTNSSNILLHQVLIDLSKTKNFQITFDYLENLLLNYRKYTCDQEDLIRSFILIFRSQTWAWCSNEFCSKILLPLLSQMKNSSQRLIILMVLQFVLFVYKDNEDFKRDNRIHDQIKQQLGTLRTMNNDECSVRDKIVSILYTYC